MSPTIRLTGGARWSRVALLLLTILSCPAGARAEEFSIDAPRSAMTVRVFRSGLFAFMAHNHEIAAPIAAGKVALSDAPSVQLKVDARRLQVLDPHLSDEDRAEVQQTMEGPRVLDVARFPDISFRSTEVKEEGRDRWVVNGELTLHGQTRPVEVEVKLEDGHYRGTARVRQREFGIRPVTFGLGTVRVKDAVEIEFDITLAVQQPATESTGE